MAYEASHCGLLSPDLGAGIRPVKGARRLGVRVGNWLTAERAKCSLVHRPAPGSGLCATGVILAMLIGCGLCRAEIVGVRVEDLERREEHRVMADGRCRSPERSAVFRAISKTEKVQSSGFTAKVNPASTREAAADCRFGPSFPTISVEPVPGFAIRPEVSWNRSNGC